MGNSVGVSVNVTNNIIDVDNDQPNASNSNVVPSTSGINRVTVSLNQIIVIFKGNLTIKIHFFCLYFHL